MTLHCPVSVQELSDVVRGAAARSQALQVRGRGSKANWGHPLETEEAVSSRAIDGILDYQPAELYMTARAGTRVRDIELALAEHNQQLGFEPCPGLPGNFSADNDGSIGGVFSCNLSGPRRFVCGAARDHLLGFSAVSGFGEPIRAGGTVVKNVTGYDMCRLMSGSFGTLAVFTELSFRVMPIPPGRITLAMTGVDSAGALRRMSELAGSSWQPSGLSWLAPGPRNQPQQSMQRNPGSGILLIRLEGTPRGTADRASRLRRYLGDHDPIVVIEQDASDRLWRAVRDLEELRPDYDDDVLVRTSLPPGNAVQLADALSCYPSCRWLADHAGGTFWIRVAKNQALRVVARTRALLSDTGGVLTVVDVPAETAGALSRFGPLHSHNAHLNGRLKANLDPGNILNPGILGSVVAHADDV